jgi:predicted phage terminase large subunit-like protein
MSKSLLPNVLRRDLKSFVAKALMSSEGTKLDPAQRYVEYICSVLMQFAKGNRTRLLINLPGRHLKTFICSICIPAFMLGRDPSLRFMIVAYDLALAEDIVRQIRDIMGSKWYRSAFKTRISSGHSQKNDFAVDGGGRVRAVSIGSVTGKGGNIIIFDDPHNVNDWDNPNKKEDVVKKFSTLLTRGDNGAKSRMLVVCHRVAEDDLSAHILERGTFEHVCLPLFAPEDMEFEIGDDTWRLAKGEALRPDAYPPDSIEDTRRYHQGSPFWLHFQQGLGQKSNDFEIDVGDFQFFKGDYRGLPVVISVDPALKTQSTSQNVIHVYAVDGQRYILLQAFAEACSFKKLKFKVVKYINLYGASAVLVEDTARGPQLIEALREETSVYIEPINPRGSKSQRLQNCSTIIKAGRVWIRYGRTEAENAIDQIVAFPNCIYDDHVDAMTNFILWVTKQRSPVRPAPASSAPLGGVIAKSPSLAQHSAPAFINGRANVGSPPVLVRTALGYVKVRR